MNELPPPLVPADADLRGFQFTPLYRARLFGSAFHASASDAEWRAGVTLYLRSWDQLPAGTLPPEDVALCRLAELGRDMRAWLHVKERALQGWCLCSDNRLHHPVVAEYVLESYARRRVLQTKGKRGAQGRWSEEADDFEQAVDIEQSTDGRSQAPAIGEYGNRQGHGYGQGQGQQAEAAALPVGISKEDIAQARSRTEVLCAALKISPATHPRILQDFPLQLNALLQEGLDFHRHILPAAQETGGRGTRILSLKYLRPLVMELRAGEGGEPGFLGAFDDTDDEGWEARLASARRIARENGAAIALCWKKEWGPPPGEAGCRVPQHLLSP